MEKTKKDKLRKRITIYLVIFSILLSFLGGYYLFTTLDFSPDATNPFKENFNMWYMLILWFILSEIVFIFVTFEEAKECMYDRSDWRMIKFLGFFISALLLMGATALIGLIKVIIEKLTLSLFLLLLKGILIIILIGIFLYVVFKGNKKIYYYIANRFFK